MLNLEELEHFTAFAEHGTLSKAAEVLHISQPTITRSMQRLEEEFGVALFSRETNKISLNETGAYALEQVRSLLYNIDLVLMNVRNFDRSFHTIRVESCTPAPLWSVLPSLTLRHPSKSVITEIQPITKIVEDIVNGECSFGIIPYVYEEEGILCKRLMEEHLAVSLPEGHPLVKEHPDALTLSDLNGHNCLLRSDIGFWEDLCRKEMPDSHFLMQEGDFEFEELTHHSSLPFFVTNLGGPVDIPHRVILPVSDAEANVTYYLIYRMGTIY